MECLSRRAVLATISSPSKSPRGGHYKLRAADRRAFSPCRSRLPQSRDAGSETRRAPLPPFQAVRRDAHTRQSSIFQAIRPGQRLLSCLLELLQARGLPPNSRPPVWCSVPQLALPLHQTTHTAAPADSPIRSACQSLKSFPSLWTRALPKLPPSHEIALSRTKNDSTPGLAALSCCSKIALHLLSGACFRKTIHGTYRLMRNVIGLLVFLYVASASSAAGGQVSS